MSVLRSKKSDSKSFIGDAINEFMGGSLALVGMSVTSDSLIWILSVARLFCMRESVCSRVLCTTLSLYARSAKSCLSMMCVAALSMPDVSTLTMCVAALSMTVMYVSALTMCVAALFMRARCVRVTKVSQNVTCDTCDTCDISPEHNDYFSVLR